MTPASISVIICTYNPRPDYLRQVLAGLQQQTLPLEQWELVLVDNNSDQDLQKVYDLSWHPAGRVVREPRPGLANARIKGVRETSGEIIVFVDDENVLQNDYLEQAAAVFGQHPHLGIIGGKALPEYETPPPPWFHDIGLIGCRDLGDSPKLTTFYQNRPANETARPHINRYPDFAPIGTGQVIKRAAFEAYQQQAAASSARTALGRTGKKLTSGEDNDIVLTVLNSGWDVGYFPALYVKHLIPARRVQPAYLAKLNHAMFRSWVYVLHIHQANPWPAIPAWSLWPRKIKSYFTHRAWQGGPRYVAWRGSCGMYEGLAEINEK